MPASVGRCLPRYPGVHGRQAARDQHQHQRRPPPPPPQQQQQAQSRPAGTQTDRRRSQVEREPSRRLHVSVVRPSARCCRRVPASRWQVARAGCVRRVGYPDRVPLGWMRSAGEGIFSAVFGPNISGSGVPRRAARSKLAWLTLEWVAARRAAGLGRFQKADDWFGPGCTVNPIGVN